jgi:hypothetical protein
MISVRDTEHSENVLTLCIRSSSHRYILWINISKMMFCGECGKTCSENVLSNGTLDITLHHDNASSHSALFLATNCMMVVPHALLPRPTPPCDIFLFPELKLILKDLISSQRISCRLHLSSSKQDLHRCFQQWKKCI